MITDEIWRKVAFAERYELSSYGNLRRRVNKTHPERHQLTYINSEVCHGGHLRCCINKQRFLVHRLVYLMFVGPLEEGKVICHIDGNPKNNHFLNLLQATQKENISHKRLHGTWQSCEKHPHAKLTNLQAITIKRLFNEAEKKSNGDFARGSVKNISEKLKIPLSLVYGLSRKRSGFKDVC